MATILELAGDGAGYEFQRLHGMGEALYARLLTDHPALDLRIYAPVGGHRDLLAYLVRRLLENGASSSFVAKVADAQWPVASLLQRPAAIIGEASLARNARIARPRDLFLPRQNSRGVEFGDRHALDALMAEIAAARRPAMLERVEPF